MNTWVNLNATFDDGLSEELELLNQMYKLVANMVEKGVILSYKTGFDTGTQK